MCADVLRFPFRKRLLKRCAVIQFLMSNLVKQIGNRFVFGCACVLSEIIDFALNSISEVLDVAPRHAR